MPRISPPGAHLPGLDGLRAYAVAVVVLFHCGVPGFTGGWIGVDVFFGLSGFLITGILAHEIDRTGGVSLGNFWRRRMRRLVPALVLLLLFCVVLALTLELELRTSGVWGAVTYTTNWVHILVPGHGYWDAFAAADPLEHLWSLAIEEQFYVVWPIVVLLVGRRVGRRGLVRVALGLAAVSLVLQVAGVAWGWSIDRLYQGTDTRAFPFLLGSALALVGLPEWSGRVRALCTATAVAVLVWATVFLDGSERSIFLGPLQAVSVAGVALVGVAALSTSVLLVHPAARALGRWSYGIYLVHWPLVLVVGDDVPTVTRVLIVSVLSVVLAAASHRFVEHPIRVNGLPGWRVAVAPVAMGTALVGALVLATPVVPDAVAERSESAIDWNAIPPSTPGSDGSAGPDASTPHQLRVAVVGDSVPALAASAITETGREHGWDVLVVAEPGCVPSPDVADQYDRATCGPFVASLHERIEGADRVVFWWGGTGEEFSWEGVPMDLCSPAAASALDGRLAWMASIAGDRPTTVVMPVERSDLDGDAAAGTRCEQDHYLRAVPSRGWDLARLDETVCPSFPDDCERLDRPDGLHYSPEDAPSAAAVVLDVVDPAGPTAPASPASAPSTVVRRDAVSEVIGDVLVVGDSTASVVAHGLSSVDRFEVLDGGMWGCPVIETVAVRPMRSEERSTDYCPDLDTQIGALELLDPEVVVVVASPPHQWDHLYTEGGDWASPGSPAWIEAHDRHMAAVVAAYPDLPIVVLDAPSARAPSDDALEDADRLAAWNAQIRRWADDHPEVVVLDWASRFPEPGTDADRELRPDGVHLTDAAVEDLTRRYLADALVEAVTEARVDIAAAS